MTISHINFSPLAKNITSPKEKHHIREANISLPKAISLLIFEVAFKN